MRYNHWLSLFYMQAITKETIKRIDDVKKYSRNKRRDNASCLARWRSFAKYAKIHYYPVINERHK